MQPPSPFLPMSKPTKQEIPRVSATQSEDANTRSLLSRSETRRPRDTTRQLNNSSSVSSPQYAVGDRGNRHVEDVIWLRTAPRPWGDRDYVPTSQGGTAREEKVLISEQIAEVLGLREAARLKVEEIPEFYEARRSTAHRAKYQDVEENGGVQAFRKRLRPRRHYGHRNDARDRNAEVNDVEKARVQESKEGDEEDDDSDAYVP